MRTRSKLLLAGLTATLVLTAAVSTASANRLAVDDSAFLAIWPELTFRADAGSEVICELSLLGSFHSRTLTKVNGSLVGHIYDGEFGVCQGDGSATLLQDTLPWHLTYNSFFEDLPAIEGINLRIIGMSVRVGEIPCLFSTTNTEPAGVLAILNSVTGQVNSFVSDPNFEIDLEDDEFLCALAGDLRLTGTASVRDKSGNLLFITLA